MLTQLWFSPLSGCQSHISGLKEEEFAAHKKALEVKRMEKPKTMAEECRRCWSEIAAGTYYFNRGQSRVVPRNIQTIGGCGAFVC